jgi:hypothetical protein
MQPVFVLPFFFFTGHLVQKSIDQSAEIHRVNKQNHEFSEYRKKEDFFYIAVHVKDIARQQLSPLLHPARGRGKKRSPFPGSDELVCLVGFTSVHR